MKKQRRLKQELQMQVKMEEQDWNFRRLPHWTEKTELQEQT